MAITISGENNNDRILAADGVIDHLSGINIVGVVTATSFSGDFIGNLTGNVTGNINNSTLLLQTGSTERVRIDSSGRVLIGTSTEGRVEADDLTIATSGSTGITLRSAAGNAGNIMFSDGTSGNDELRGVLQYHHLDNSMRFSTDAVRRLTIDSVGRLLLHYDTASRNVGTKTGQLQVINTGNNAAISIIQNNNAASAPFLCFGKTRSGNNTGSTIVQNNDSLGQILFCGADGTDVDSIGAWILAQVDGTPGSNDMPGRLIFSTTADGGPTPIERLRISSNGDVRVGGGVPATFGSGTTVHETYNANTYVANLVTSGTHQLQMIASQSHGATSIGTRSNHNLSLTTNDTTRLTIDTNGDMGLGGSPITSGYTSFTIHEPGTSSGDHVRFNMTNGNTGNTASDGFSITVNASSKNVHYIQREAADMAFQNTGGRRLTIKSDGKIGIGDFLSITPARAVHIHEASSAAVYATFTNSSTGTAANNGFTLGIDSAQAAILNNYSSTDIKILCNGAERLRIAPNYLVTVGNNNISSTTQPSKLRIQGSYVNAVGPFGILEFKNRDNSGEAVCSIRGVRDAVAGGNYSAGFTFHTNSANPASASDGDYERLRITSTGLVGVNCTPVGMFEVQKNGVPAIIANYNNSKHIQMGAGSNGAGFHLTDGNFFTINHQPYADRGTDNNLTERFRIHASGAVTKPNNPSFRINRSVGNNYTSTTGEILPWNVVEWDKTNVTGYGYNTSTYKYRVAVAGVYWFHCSVYTDANIDVMFDICKNTTGGFIQRAELRQTGNDDIGNNTIVHCAGLSQCAVGDYIFCYNSGGTNIELIGGNAEGYVDFSGYLVG